MLKWWFRGAVYAALVMMAVSVWFSRSSFSDAEQHHEVGIGLVGAMNLRTQLVEYFFMEGRWPSTLDQVDFGRDIAGGADIDLSIPYQLQVTPVPGPYDGGLEGARVNFTFDPQSGAWRCEPGKPPIPAKWLPSQCGGPGYQPGVSVARYWLTVFALIGLLGLVIVGLNHPQLLPLLRDPSRLRRVPVDQVKQIDKMLRFTMRLPATLRASGVAPAQWQRIKQFPKQTAEQQSTILAARLGMRSTANAASTLPWPGFSWEVPADFPVSMLRCQAVLINDQRQLTEVADRLRRDLSATELLILVVPQQAVQQQLDNDALVTQPNLVLLDPEKITSLLLATRPVEDFVALASRQIRRTRLSPYQTRGGVTRAASFFGRDKELASLLSSDSNFLLLGGRQLGKTSLLKAVQRDYQERRQGNCRYVVLRDHQLTPALARQAGLAADASLDQCVEALRDPNNQQRLTLLVDEADVFARWEHDHGYPTLNTARALSEEGQVRFVFAGFWDLYRSAVLDYQSPLRNFGESISVGALEAHACRELATKPLAMLGISYSQPSLIDDIVTSTGGRANLVALVAQQCLESLQVNQRVIEPATVEVALRSEQVTQALAGWGRLSSDEAASRLDRIIIYAAAESGSIRLSDITNLFEQAKLTLDPQRITAALQRLQLAFILQPWDAGYRFCVPLFRQQITIEDTHTLLRQELLAWRGQA